MKPLDEQLGELRSFGWRVAVHNDYRQDGKLMTFWLFTHPNGFWIKGEGETDATALEQCRVAANDILENGCPTQSSEHTDDAV